MTPFKTMQHVDISCLDRKCFIKYALPLRVLKVTSCILNPIINHILVYKTIMFNYVGINIAGTIIAYHQIIEFTFSYTYTGLLLFLGSGLNTATLHTLFTVVQVKQVQDLESQYHIGQHSMK